MSDRDRRIDSLFAERVLGLRLDQLCDGCANEDGIAQWRCDTCHAEGRWDEGTTHNFTPAPYTRSLDAAWEGVKIVCGKRYAMLLETQGALGPGWMRATITPPDGQLHVWMVAEHPAEALVLAMLRAVGCTEEEISGA